MQQELDLVFKQPDDEAESKRNCLKNTLTHQRVRSTLEEKPEKRVAHPGSNLRVTFNPAAERSLTCWWRRRASQPLAVSVSVRSTSRVGFSHTKSLLPPCVLTVHTRGLHVCVCVLVTVSSSCVGNRGLWDEQRRDRMIKQREGVKTTC